MFYLLHGGQGFSSYGLCAAPLVRPPRILGERAFKTESYSLRESCVKAEQPLMLLLNRLQPFTPLHTHTHTVIVHREIYANAVEAPQPFERKWARERERERA